MPACCDRPSCCPPVHPTASSFLRGQHHVLATSLANLGQWSGLHVAYSLLQVSASVPGLQAFPVLCGLCQPILTPDLLWELGQPDLDGGPAVCFHRGSQSCCWPTGFLSCLLDPSELQTQGSPASQRYQHVSVPAGRQGCVCRWGAQWALDYFNR